MRCPTCGADFHAKDSGAPPFCGERCRTIDLGRWLDERQALPAAPAIDDSEGLDGEALEWLGGLARSPRRGDLHDDEA